MAKNKKLYSASADHSATITLLIAYLAINVFGYIGYQSISCGSGRLAQGLMDSLEMLAIAAAVLAFYGLISLIKRRITLKPLPLEVPAALFSVFASLGYAGFYFLSCERII